MDGIKFEFNDIISLYFCTKNDSERSWYVLKFKIWYMLSKIEIEMLIKKNCALYFAYDFILTYCTSI